MVQNQSFCFRTTTNDVFEVKSVSMDDLVMTWSGALSRVSSLLENAVFVFIFSFVCARYNA